MSTFGSYTYGSYTYGTPMIATPTVATPMVAFAGWERRVAGRVLVQGLQVGGVRRHHPQVHAPLVSELAEDGDLVRGRDRGRS